MAELLRTELDTDHRYRITRTDRGILLSSQMRSQAGLLLGPAEWLYRTEEAATKGLEFMLLMNAYSAAITQGYAPRDLPERCEKAATDHKATIERLSDQPLIGREVRDLRRAIGVDDD
jgi:hypothetical protein